MPEGDRQTLISYYRSQLDKLTGPGVPSNRQKLETPHYWNELLKLGDPDVLARVVKTVMTSDNNSTDFRKAASDLLRAARPETLEMLAPVILVDEPFVVAPMQGDVGSPPPKSFSIANMLLRIVATSPAFGDEVRTWADDNSKVSYQKTLSMIRQWWRDNEQLLREKDYGKVRPGTDLRTSELAGANVIQMRKQAYRDELIAKGKSPADPANWEDWQKVVYPSLASEISTTTFPAPPAPRPIASSSPTVAPSSALSSTESSSPSMMLLSAGAVVAVAALMAFSFSGSGAGRHHVIRYWQQTNAHCNAVACATLRQPRKMGGPSYLSAFRQSRK